MMEIDSLMKENLKSKKFLIQIIQKIWNTMQRSKTRMIGIEEKDEFQLKGTEIILNKSIGENFPNLKKDMPMKKQEIYTVPNRMDQRKKKTLYHIITKTLTYKIKNEY